MSRRHLGLPQLRPAWHGRWARLDLAVRRARVLHRLGRLTLSPPPTV